MRRMLVVAMSLAALVAIARAQDPYDESLPKWGEYVYVEELPEAVIKATPVYPEEARQAGVDGVVLVQVLVNREGFVADTRVVKSIPMLDRAAVECVRQWRFRPALSNGKPVAVWVAVPVKFALHGFDAPQPGAPPSTGSREFGPLPGSGNDLLAGPYFMNADSSSRLIITNIDGDRVRLESPGDWEGAGVVYGTTYWGVFAYRADAREPKNRGARGTHFGTLEPSGRLLVEGTFANRPWPGFKVTWTPLMDLAGLNRGEGRRQRGQSVNPDREAPGELRHPLWPPETGREDGTGSAPSYEHPVWPPEWSTGDTRIMLAEQSGTLDESPGVIRRVEPVVNLERVLARGADALVVVRVQVARDGSVSGAWIAQSVPGLDAAALRAVRQWRFRPARIAGRQVPAAVYVPVRFARR